MVEALTVYIVAGGPSLINFDFAPLEDKNVIAIATPGSALKVFPMAAYTNGYELPKVGSA